MGSKPTQDRGRRVDVWRFVLVGDQRPLTSAHADGPTAKITCTGQNEIPLSGSGFPPNFSYRSFVYIKPADRDYPIVFDMGPFQMDSTGSFSTPSISFGALPEKVAFVAYQDTNGNGRWDPDTDETSYSGAATVTTCPSVVTLSPK